MSLIEDLKRHLSIPRNDDRLHFSQHLQHDRHTAIYHVYGYPTTRQTWGRLFPLLQGTGVHDVVHRAMADIYPKYIPEHEIVAYHEKLRYHWGGTADAYVEIDGQAWLLDYKTISGPGTYFLGDEPKPEHVWQVSAYYHFGPTQNVKTGILYLPTGPDYTGLWHEPSFFEFTPIAKSKLVAKMREVERACDEYSMSGKLPPAPEGTYTWKKVRRKKDLPEKWELNYKPHYLSMFCPWAPLDDDPCGCSHEKARKVAVYENGVLSDYDDDDYEKIEEIGGPKGVFL